MALFSKRHSFKTRAAKLKVPTFSLHANNIFSCYRECTPMAHIAVTIISSPGQHILGTKVHPLFSYLCQGLPTQLLSPQSGTTTHTGYGGSMDPSGMAQIKAATELQRGDHGGYPGH